jgi:AraC-like DNA-binding protein/PAS domain-containing protein
VSKVLQDPGQLLEKSATQRPPGRSNTGKGQRGTRQHTFAPTVFFGHDSASRRLRSPSQRSTVDRADIQERFFSRVAGDIGLQAFDLLEDVFLFVKDAERRFVFYNRAFRHLMGVGSSDELLGLRDEDISPEYLVERYRHDDEQALEGSRLADIVELVRDTAGGYDWFITSKCPVMSRRGRVIGVLGVTRKLQAREGWDGTSYISDLAPAVELMLREFHSHLTVEQLADAAGFSSSQFSRLFKRRFRVTPHQYLRQIRVEAACELLATTDSPLSVVAEKTGFYDQSHMTNCFAQTRGMSPSRYREAFQLRERRRTTQLT